MLESLLPPREFEEGGQGWVQRVSRRAASREDVVELSKLLGEKLQQRQARQEGICQVLCWQCLSRQQLRAGAQGAVQPVHGRTGAPDHHHRPRARPPPTQVQSEMHNHPFLPGLGLGYKIVNV